MPAPGGQGSRVGAGSVPRPGAISALPAPASKWEVPVYSVGRGARWPCRPDCNGRQGLKLMTSAERDDFIVQWLPLAWQGCRRFMKTGILLDDLRQEAVVGLILAVDTFDPDRGSHFLPYAAKSINNHLRSMCAKQMRAFKIPNYLNNWVIKVRRAVISLRLKGIVNPSWSLLSEQSGLSLDQVARVFSVSWVRIPLTDHPGVEEDEPIDLRDILSPLSIDQQDVLIMHFGLLGERAHSLRQLAAAEGVTYECIRKREKNALTMARWVAQA